MRTDVIVLSYAAPLSDIERTLSENRISGAPVVDEAGHIVGIVSLRDLVDRYAQDPDARPRRGPGFFHLSTEELGEGDFRSFEVPAESEETAQDVMTAEVFAVPMGASLPEIARTMAEHRIHRVLVEDEKRYVGLISTMEIIDSLCS